MFRRCTKSDKNDKSKIKFSVLTIVVLLAIILCNIVVLVKPKENSLVVNAKDNKSSYVLIEQSTNRVLKGENEHFELPMASTTKIMTALIVLEKSNLNDIVTIPNEAIGVEGSSIYLKKDEKMSVKDLLYGLMLRSGNDSAVALAIHTAGSVDKFVTLMNEKAKSMGLKNTQFKNPHGLSKKGHYTSAYDLAIIASNAMNNPIFKEIVGTKLHTVNGDENVETRYFANKNRILYNYSGGNGIKTGYTTEAGRCLVASSEKNGMQVIAVAINRYDYFDFCSKLMDYAYENYCMEKILDKNNAYAEIAVKKGGKIKKAKVYPACDLYYPIKKDGSEEIKTEITTVEYLIAPHKAQTSCGTIKIYIGNHLKFEEKLYTIYNIDKKFSISDIWS